MITEATGKGQQPTLKPAFLDVFYPAPYLRAAEQAFQAEPGAGDGTPSLQDDAQQAADLAVRSAILNHNLLDDLRDYADQQVLGVLAAEIDIAASPGASRNTDQGLLAVVCARDLAYYWVLPAWRLQLSYRQLVQSRLWVSAIGEPQWQPFAAHVCAFEEAVRALSGTYIEQHLNPTWLTPWVAQIAKRLHKGGSVASAESLHAVALVSIARALLAKVVVPIQADYDRSPAIRNHPKMADFLRQRHADEALALKVFA